ncbi:hypothetical protein Tco_0737991 [Tanacetum coccineum]
MSLIHGFSELHQLDTFYNSLNTNDQDALDSAAGGNFLDKMPRDGLAIIESKSKVRYSRSRAIEPRVSTNAPLSTSTPSNSFEFQQLAASLEDKMDIRMSRLEKMISEKNVTTPATVKAVEEVCVTCGSNHNFNNCPLTRNEFPVFHDNIHQFQQTAAVGNFVQRNPPNLANQMRPPGNSSMSNRNNPRVDMLYAITTRSGKTCEGPSTPLVPTPVVSTPQKEPEQNPETSTDKVQKPSSENTAQVPPPEEEDSIFIEIPKPKAKKTVNVEIQEPNSPKPTSYQPKLPYPERMKMLSSNAEIQHMVKLVAMEQREAEEFAIHKIITDSQEGNFQVHSNPLFEFDDNFKSSTINPLFDEMEEDVEIENSNEPVLLQTPLSDKGECFDLGDDIDENDAFLAIEISMDYEEGYYDSGGDVLFLESLLCEDTTHNFSSEVISDHDTSISFSPRSDPLHHEFAGEAITLPSRNDREFEDYLNRMTVLCEISTFRSQENVHANQSSIIESLPVSLIPVEDSDPVQEEIDIFLVPDDLIPPGDDSEDEDIELPNNDHQDDPSIPRPPPEPPDVEKCLEPEAGVLITKVFKGGFL